jgi:hypothetical protein
MSGLGGAGARGYLVISIDAAGEVGDFSVAGDISPVAIAIAPEPLLWVFVD